VRIQSGKHDASTAFSHGTDIEEIFSNEKYKKFCHVGKDFKPVL